MLYYQNQQANMVVNYRNLFFVLPVLVIAVVGFAFFTPTAAQDNAALKARIDELLATVAKLEAQLQETKSQSRSFGPFTRTLSLGDRGEEVQQLQKILNEQHETRIALYGPGSKGNETNYFGTLTKEAVFRYQELHRDEILVPAGVSMGTGVFGPTTRKHMNKALQTGVLESPAPIKTEQESGGDDTSTTFSFVKNPITGLNSFLSDHENTDTLVVSSISDYTAKRGDTVQLSGTGFTKEGNDIHIGEKSVLQNRPSENGTHLSFTIPESTPLGLHDISVTNEKGAGDSTLFLVVYEGDYTPPVVDSISPEEGLYGEEVVLRGSGFTKEGNQIRASYGIIDDVPSSDGTTLRFKVTPPIEGVTLEEGVDLGQGIEIPYYFYVVNDNGFSRQPVKFIGKI